MKKVMLLITVVILVLLYARIDRQAFLQQLRTMHLGVFFLALTCFVPQVLVTAWRWRWMAWDVYPFSVLAATRLILAGKALNALLPSKLGETSKAYFLKTHANVALAHGVALVLLEKVLDVAGLCAMLLLGMLLTPRLGVVEISATLIALGSLAMVTVLCVCRTTALRRWLQHRIDTATAGSRRGRRWITLQTRLLAVLNSWDTILAQWRHHPYRLAGIVGLSCGLWSLHLVQIFLFFVALESVVGIRLVFAYVPIAIFIGLLPITIGGMGTRDAALMALFAPYEGAALMAGIGLLCSTRYWLDSLLGWPFFQAYSFAKGR